MAPLLRNPPGPDLWGNPQPVIQCCAEVRRSDGRYGFVGCKRPARHVFRLRGVTLYYCDRHATRGDGERRP